MCCISGNCVVSCFARNNTPSQAFQPPLKSLWYQGLMRLSPTLIWPLVVYIIVLGMILFLGKIQEFRFMNESQKGVETLVSQTFEIFQFAVPQLNAPTVP